MTQGEKRMKSHTRGTMAGLVGLALLLAVLVSPGTADDEKGMPKEVREGVLKVAGDLAAGKADDAKKDAAALKGKDLKYPMKLFKLRKNLGLGIGPKPGAEEKADGIERKLEKLADKEEAPSDAQIVKEAEALEQAGYHVAAIAIVAEIKAPTKDDGKKKVKDWMKWSKEMQAAGLELASAAKAKNAAGIKAAAKKTQDVCTQCHDVFRGDD
jgi:hypothetical protein